MIRNYPVGARTWSTLQGDVEKRRFAEHRAAIFIKAKVIDLMEKK